MLNMNNEDALGIIFPNSYDALIPELVTDRLIASIPFAGRYRMCDFIISSMVHSGMSNISLIVKKNYHSLMDHLGSGQEFDLARKNGGLNIVPPYAQRNIQVYSGRIEALESIKGYLNKCTEKYVILADSNLAFNFDFRQLIDAHKKTDADVTLVYRKQEIPKVFLRPNSNTNRDLYYTLDIDDGRVKKIYINSRQAGVQNFCMNIYVFERKKLIRLVEDAYVHGYSYFTRDLLSPQTNSLNIQGYEYDGYVAQICDMKSYFDETMRLLKEENRNALFKGNSIYTKVRDDNPTRYIAGAKAKNVMVADGCVIEGEIENCVLFRGVKIGKGAKVKNCILLQDTVIEEGANLEYVVTDKDVTVSRDKSLTGNESFQVYVAKGQTI